MKIFLKDCNLTQSRAVQVDLLLSAGRIQRKEEILMTRKKVCQKKEILKMKHAAMHLLRKLFGSPLVSQL